MILKKHLMFLTSSVPQERHIAMDKTSPSQTTICDTVAARAKASACGRSLSGTAVSNPAGEMDVSLL
jgi:hypothetical protein